MVLIEWWLVERLTVGLAIIAVATTSFWLVRKKGSWLPIQILSVLAVTCGLLSIAFVWWAATTSHIYSPPVCSPNGKMSARIDDYSAGGFGGSYNSVELFRNHGFRSEVVFYGDKVKTGDILWKSDSELNILYEGPLATCTNTALVTVRCIARQALSKRANLAHVKNAAGML